MNGKRIVFISFYINYINYYLLILVVINIFAIYFWVGCNFNNTETYNPTSDIFPIVPVKSVLWSTNKKGIDLEYPLYKGNVFLLPYLLCMYYYSFYYI